MDGSAQLPVTYLTDKILILGVQRLLQLSSFLRFDLYSLTQLLRTAGGLVYTVQLIVYTVIGNLKKSVNPSQTLLVNKTIVFFYKFHREKMLYKEWPT